MDTYSTIIRKNYSLLIMISKSQNDLVMIPVYFNLITIYESMGTAKSPLGMKSWSGDDLYVSMDTYFTKKG